MRPFAKFIFLATILISHSAILGCGGETTSPKEQSPRPSGNAFVDLERQRADLEKQRRELAETQLREREAIDRERRGLLETQARAGATEQFDAADFQRIKEYVKENADRLGRALLDGTHPTGTYGSTGQPSAYLSNDRRAITVSLTVYWKGGITENDYETTYSARLDKREGLSNLKATRDTALIQIDPQYMHRTEIALREQFK